MTKRSAITMAAGLAMALLVGVTAVSLMLGGTSVATASGQHRKRSPIGRRHALAGLSGRAQPEVQQIDLRWRQQAYQDLMRRATCDRLPVRWSGRTRRARRQSTTRTIRSTMPSGER